VHPTLAPLGSRRCHPAVAGVEVTRLEKRMANIDEDSKLGFNGTWSMAVGGMVGGGIFSTLGVVISIAGAWAWFSFAAAGVIAFLSGYSYVKLASRYDKGGGAFTFLREIRAYEFAGSLAWTLIVGYVLTNAVYAFTFGQYLAYVFGLGSDFARVAAAAVVVLFIGLNLRRVADASGVEIFLVWFKLVVLVGLATLGLLHWNPAALSRGVPDTGIGTALFAAASVFMAYEGFQLVTYDYADIAAPRRTLPIAVLSAIVTVALVYVLVTLGTVMLIGAGEVASHEEVALAIAGREAFGQVGLILVTVGAAFSTGSAINSTLFATARLSREVARHKQLPASLDHRNAAGIPDRAVIGLGAVAALFAVIGSLDTLVRAASLTFLFTFAVVCALAFREAAGSRAVTGFGAVACASATVALIVRLSETDPFALVALLGLAALAVFGRAALLRKVKTSGRR
jgi:amino acid transporter